MFWGEYGALWWAVAGLLVIAALLLRTGITHFNREELLGRDLDVLNLKWVWRTFWETFKGQATSLLTWFTVELRGTLRKMRLPFMIMFFVLLASLWVGGTQSKEFALPPELVQFESLETSNFTGFDKIKLFSVAGIRTIWIQNVRVLLAATLLGIFTYGVLGLMVTMLPFLIIGYFLAIVASAGYSPWLFFTAFVLPHGIFEIPAILLASAAIFRMGAGMAARQEGKSIGAGLLHSFADWAKIMIGVVLPLLLLAAAAEALLTPQIALWIYSR